MLFASALRIASLVSNADPVEPMAMPRLEPAFDAARTMRIGTVLLCRPHAEVDAVRVFARRSCPQ